MRRKDKGPLGHKTVSIHKEQANNQTSKQLLRHAAPHGITSSSLVSMWGPKIETKRQAGYQRAKTA